MAIAMRSLSPLLVSAAIVLTLDGCAADTENYPSLARRPAERVTGTFPVSSADPAVPATPAAPNPEVAGKLAGLVGQARAADARFAAREPRARQLTSAAAGARVASEPWSVATIALADLESARSDAMIALADLDAQYTAERVSGGEGAAIAEARDQVTALVVHQDRVLAELHGRLAN